jgi:hypothetical protein
VRSKSFVPLEILSNLALLLAAEDAYTITGTAIPVDGGWSAGHQPLNKVASPIPSRRRKYENADENETR